MTDTNQASEDMVDDFYSRPPAYRTKENLRIAIRTEKLKLLDEVIHQSTINLKSAKAVAGWAEIRKKQLEAEL